jgi:hypothetical protein
MRATQAVMVTALVVEVVLGGLVLTHGNLPLRRFFHDHELPGIRFLGKVWHINVFGIHIPINPVTLIKFLLK